MLTRTQAARDAGLSDDQRKTALRVAAVPADVFEPRVESKTPPTVTQLALLGTTRRQNGRAAEREHHNRALAACAALVRFHHHALPLDPRAFVAALRVEGDELITTYARQAEAWLAAILWELARDDEESGAAQQQDDHTEAS